MTERLLKTVQTVIDMKTYSRAVVTAWRALLGSDPTKAQAGVLWAQYGIETGAGPWCWNWNIGNVKHVAGDGHDYVMLADVIEYVRGQKVTFQPPNPATWFRAFASLDEAMVEHLKFLRGRRYRVAWPAVEAGDCDAFAELLKGDPNTTADDYYTAPVAAYAAGMRWHYGRWMRSNAFEEALAELAEPSIVTPDQLEPEAAIVYAIPDPPKRDPPPDAA